MSVCTPPDDRPWHEWASLLGRRGVRLVAFLITLPLGLYWGTRGAEAWTAAILPRTPTRIGRVTVRCVAPTVIGPLSVACRDGYRVRLAGIAAPHRPAVHTLAPDAALRRLIGTGSLELVVPSGPTSHDGAVRAYAFLADAGGGAPRFLNAQLARAGVVKLDTTLGVAAFDQRIARAAQAARDERRGVWATGADRR